MFIRKSILVTASLAVLMTVSLTFATEPRTTIVLTSDDDLPSGGEIILLGALSDESAPILNSSGQVAFEVLQSNSRGWQIWRGNNLNNLVPVFSIDIPAADGDGDIVGVDIGAGTSSRRYSFALSDSGQVAAALFHSGSIDGLTGNYISDGSTQSLVVRSGTETPSENGIFGTVLLPPQDINATGQTVFSAILNQVDPDPLGVSFGTGIYRGDGQSPLVTIVQSGDPLPDGSGLFDVSPDYNFSMNNLGQVAFQEAFRSDIYLGDGSGTPISVVQVGDEVSGKNATINSINEGVQLNDASQILYSASYQNNTDANIYGSSIFLKTGTSGPSIVASYGDSLSSGNSLEDWDYVKLNENGQVAFAAITDSPSTSWGGYASIAQGDIASGLVELVRAGDIVDDENGRLRDIDDFTFNDHGQIAFLAAIDSSTDMYTSDIDQALFFYDDELGLMTVARQGDEMLGSTIVGLDYMTSNATNPISLLNKNRGKQDGFNNAGQVAYRFALDDGRSGIAIWSVPEPSSLAMLGLGASRCFANGVKIYS